MGVGALLGKPIWMIMFPSSLLLPLMLGSLWLARSAGRSVLALTLFVLLILLGPLMEFRRYQAPLKKRASGELIRVVSLNAASWNVDLVDVGRRTAELRPDILILQEMWWLRHLKSFKVGMPALFFRGDGSGFRGLAIGTRYSFEDCPWPPPDGVLGGIMSIGKQRVLVLSLHGLKSSSGFSDPVATGALQEKQAEEVLDYIEAVDLPTVLGGDFNSTPAAPLGRALASRLEDVFWSEGRGYGYTFPAKFPVSRLDRVMLTKGLAVVDSFSLVDVGSDHLAVVLDFRLRSSQDDLK